MGRQHRLSTRFVFMVSAMNIHESTTREYIRRLSIKPWYWTTLQKRVGLFWHFCAKEDQAMYFLLAETGKQSYFEKFSHLHSCVHPRWIQDHKSSWTIPLYLYKWHCPYCSCGYSEHTHQCLQRNQHNDECHHDCVGRMKINLYIINNNNNKKNWSRRQQRLLIKLNRQ